MKLEEEYAHKDEYTEIADILKAGKHHLVGLTALTPSPKSRITPTNLLAWDKAASLGPAYEFVSCNSISAVPSINCCLSARTACQLTEAPHHRRGFGRY